MTRGAATIRRALRSIAVRVGSLPFRYESRLTVPVLAALAMTAVAAQRGVSSADARIDALIARMTLEEKLGQLQQLDGEANGNFRPEHVVLARAGRLGSTLNVRGASRTNELQKAAVEGSRLGIPLIFAFDVIHGYRTIFPIPLGEAASWDPAAAEQSAAIAAAEARAAGVHWTFAPMVDVARDARWGRMAEGAGEDPYLGSVFAAARVRGFQGSDYSQPDRVLACAKHWVAYGAAEAGRDYNTVDVSERTLRTVYFPPFEAAIDAGVGSLMSAFNDLNGVPASANPFTLTEVLRQEWGFDGVVVSDYNSVIELVNHGVAAGKAEAAVLALSAGVDMEMVSRSYGRHLADAIRRQRIGIEQVDRAVRRVVRIKQRAGLFDRPYAEAARERATLLTPAHRAAAREIAARSMVLLSNDGTLPLSPNARRLAVIGPLADDRANMLGNWTGDGRPGDVVTILAGIRDAVSRDTLVTTSPGARVDATMLDATGGHRADPAGTRLIEEAVAAAEQADAVVLVLGETGAMSGEAASRALLELPGRQQELAERVIAAGRPTAVVLLSGRALAIAPLSRVAPAILAAWFPGTEAGHAVADVVFGRVNPGGKLPVTFPRTTGQVPIYYSQKPTGRPPAEDQKYTSKYLDTPWTPLYPFGHGLSYTRFRLRDLELNRTTMPPDGELTVSVMVENTGARTGDEVVQLYIRDLVATVTRPVAELRGFERVSLEPGASRRVTFTLGPKDLGLFDRSMKWVVEPGTFLVRVGTSSVGGLEATVEVTR